MIQVKELDPIWKMLRWTLRAVRAYESARSVWRRGCVWSVARCVATSLTPWLCSLAAVLDGSEHRCPLTIRSDRGHRASGLSFSVHDKRTFTAAERPVRVLAILFYALLRGI